MDAFELPVRLHRRTTALKLFRVGCPPSSSDLLIANHRITSTTINHGSNPLYGPAPAVTPRPVVLLWLAQAPRAHLGSWEAFCCWAGGELSTRHPSIHPSLMIPSGGTADSGLRCTVARRPRCPSLDEERVPNRHAKCWWLGCAADAAAVPRFTLATHHTGDGWT